MPKYALLAGLVLGAVPAVAIAATSVQVVSLPPTPFDFQLDPGLVATIPIRWSGPAPINPDLSNITFDFDLAIVSRVSGTSLTDGDLLLSHLYSFEFEPGRGVFSGPLPDDFFVTIANVAGTGPFDATVTTNYAPSFSTAIDPSFDFTSDTFYELRLLAEAGDVEDNVTDFFNSVALEGTVTITVVTAPDVPTPPAFALFGLGAMALGLSRRA